jgi:hypothetical protein
MPEDLVSESVRAVHHAAERLGVDPYRLARFLGDGRLAEVLDAVGGTTRVDAALRLRLAEEFLRFLDHEIEAQNGRRPQASRG